jgi:hypothetical protein
MSCPFSKSSVQIVQPRASSLEAPSVEPPATAVGAMAAAIPSGCSATALVCCGVSAVSRVCSFVAVAAAVVVAFAGGTSVVAVVVLGTSA